LSPLCHAPRLVAVFSVSLWLILFVFGCATPPNPDHATAAKTLFEATVRNFHFPSATATGSVRDQLLRDAAIGYEHVLRDYPDQDSWCAKSLRSLANVRAEQGRLDAAVQLYARVAQKYPHQDWEVLIAWKTAADLLWDAGRQPEARGFYRQIVTRFDSPGAPPVIKTIVHTATTRT